MKYVIIREPSSMEDEGRCTLVGQADDLTDAQRIRKERDEEGSGYFRNCHRIYKRMSAR